MLHGSSSGLCSKWPRGAHRSCLGPPPQGCASPGLSSEYLIWEPAWLQVVLGCPALSIPLLSFSLFPWLSHPFQVSVFLRHVHHVCHPFPWPWYPDSSCCLQAGHWADAEGSPPLRFSPPASPPRSPSSPRSPPALLTLPSLPPLFHQPSRLQTCLSFWAPKAQPLDLLPRRAEGEPEQAHTPDR